MATQAIPRKDMLWAAGLLHRVSVERLELLSVSNQTMAEDADGDQVPMAEAIASWTKTREHFARMAAAVRKEMTVVEVAEYEVKRMRLHSVGAKSAPLI